MARIKAVTCVLFLLLSGLASAADSNGLFSIRGAGLLKCVTYVQEREKASEAYIMIGGWLDGYVTAVNELSQETFDVVPFESTELLTILIYRHCKDNPKDIVFAVTNTLLAKLYDDRLKSSSSYTDVRVGSDQMRLYTHIIVRIQESLAAKGLLDTEATGKWSAETEQALAKYQKSVGLDGTGFPDQTTLWRLLRSV